MNPVILFGLPGAGKTFAGEILRSRFGYHIYNGDESLTRAMKQRIDDELPLTDAMRDEFFTALIEQVWRLSETHTRLAVPQTFIKEKYRQQFLRAFPDALFVLVTADDAVREKRLAERWKLPLGEAYARQLASLFEPPRIAHRVVTNNANGEDAITGQLYSMLER